GFRMPDSKRILTLWIAARVFALRARRRADALAARGLPPAFLDELDAQIADFGEVIALKKAGARMHNAALVQAETAVEAGRKAVRRLDGVVFNACHDNPRVLAAWDTARRIVYARPAAKAASSHADATSKSLPLSA
ncbi:MAG TPA: hypothetical protein VG871_19645, partial [Vicinamibacterales bacterium]|nr:hypothetical protein [Vicinamibacterales bacterium]